MIVVTGGYGFLGQAVVAELLRCGVVVKAATRNAGNARQDAARAIVVRDYAELERPESGDVLVHLAEPRDATDSSDNENEYAAERRAALDSLLARKWAHVVYASSAVVYDDRRTIPSRAADASNPMTTYARAKVACERSVLAHGGSVARLTNVFGPGMAPNNVLSDILAQIPGEGPLTVRDVTPVRDYLWVEDAARGLATLAMTRREGIFNFGTGEGVSVGELARTALSCAGQAHRAVSASHPGRGLSWRVLDISETTKHIGWKPSMPLQQGILRLLGAPS